MLLYLQYGRLERLGGGVIGRWGWELVICLNDNTQVYCCKPLQTWMVIAWIDNLSWSILLLSVLIYMSLFPKSFHPEGQPTSESTAFRSERAAESCWSTLYNSELRVDNSYLQTIFIFSRENTSLVSNELKKLQKTPPERTTHAWQIGSMLLRKCLDYSHNERIWLPICDKQIK